jgi:hypothetical protein
MEQLLGRKMPTAAGNFWIRRSPSPSPNKKKTPSPAKPKQMSPERVSKAIDALYRFKAKQKGLVYTNKGNNFGEGQKYGFALSKPEVYWSHTSTSFGEPVNLADYAKTPRTSTYAVKEVTGHQHIGGRPYFRETISTAAVGTIDPSVSFLNINLVMFSPPQTASATLYKSGKVLISTSGPWERVVRILFAGKIRTLIANAKKTTTMSRFYCNQNVDVEFVFKSVYASNLKSMKPNNSNMTMHQELPTSLRGVAFHQTRMGPAPAAKPKKGFKSKIGIVFKNPDVKLNIFRNGTITATCEDPADGPKAFKKLIKLIDTRDKEISMFVFGFQRNAPAALRTTENLRKQKINQRNPLANSWNSVKPGFYVRPGANGKPRYYEVPTNKSLVRTKVIRAYANAKVNIPASVKQLLEIANNTVKNKAGKPSGFGNQSRNTHYVKPDIHGKPSWYKIPAGKAAAKGGVINAYKKHNIAIPAHIRTMFKITNANIASRKTNEPKVTMSPGGQVKLNGKQLLRFNKNVLLRVARNMNISSVTNKNNKETILTFIRGKLSK